MKKRYPLIWLLIWLSAISLPGCTKNVEQIASTNGTVNRNNNGYNVQMFANDTDTSQNIYVINAISNPIPGIILMAPFQPGNNGIGYLFITNQNGHVIKQKKINGAVGKFQRWNINGKTRYSYNVYDLTGYIIQGAGYLPGYEIITDSNLNEIDRVQLMPDGQIGTGVQKSLDGHDFIMIDDHHYIIESYYQKTVSNIPTALDTIGNTKVIADIIQEIYNGTVIWQWDGTDYPEFYSTSIEQNQFSDSSVTYDYMHLNSMFIDPKDNNLICSFRNLNQIVKIERGTGKILWRLGGNNSDFALNSDQIFLRQHNATLEDDNETLLLFDDGEINSRRYSRVVEFNINETSKSVIGFKSFNIPENFTQYMGSVQKHGNTYFIGGGTANYVLEVNALTGEKMLEIMSPYSFYRAYKYY